MSIHTPNSRQATATHQSGVVLIVSLVMLAVISLASVAIMRNAMSTDAVSENNRRNGQAVQAAQAALLYCESQIQQNLLTPQAKVTTATPAEKWTVFANWSATAANGGPEIVPTSFLTNGTTNQSRFTAANSPQCMAQNRTVAGTTDTVIVVTARGFSDDYEQSTTGQTTAGSVVWLQSIIRLSAAG